LVSSPTLTHSHHHTHKTHTYSHSRIAAVTAYALGVEKRDVDPVHPAQHHVGLQDSGEAVLQGRNIATSEGCDEDNNTSSDPVDSHQGPYVPCRIFRPGGHCSQYPLFFFFFFSCVIYVSIRVTVSRMGNAL